MGFDVQSVKLHKLSISIAFRVGQQHETVSDVRHTDLDVDSIFRCAPKSFYFNVLQIDKTKLFLKILLWGKCKCSKSTDLGTLIVNLLLVMKKGLIRFWSFSDLAAMMRITLMYYVDFYSLFNHLAKDWETCLYGIRKDIINCIFFDLA